MAIPKLDAVFTGTGDLFSSVFLAWISRHQDNLALACEKTVSTVQTVLKRTMQCAEGESLFLTSLALPQISPTALSTFNRPFAAKGHVNDPPLNLIPLSILQ